MGFTKSTDDLKIHQKLSDEPNIDDGLSAEELKLKFDKPVTDLQKSFNKLIDELENAQASKYIGAEPLDEYDDTENNVQAKLLKIRAEIQNITLGQIPDGSITEPKLNTEYSRTIAKKDTIEQIGLNSEMVGGKTFNDILKIITNSIKIGTYTGTSNGTSAYGGGNKTIEIGFKPRFVITIGGNYLALDFSETNQRTVYSFHSSSTSVNRVPVTFNETGISVSITGTNCEYYAMNRLDTAYTYIAFK